MHNGVMKPGTYDPTIIAEIGSGATPYSDGVNNVGDYFEIKRPTQVVIAPGSDMPYCLVHWVDPSAVPGNGDGWPAQAANPAAYVSLINTNQDSHEIDWQPILLSHKPITLSPGYYVPALPQIAFWGNQWDHEHAYPSTQFEYPIISLMESDTEVEMCPYQFTTKLVDAQVTVDFPWLLTPTGTGLASSTTNLVYNKLLGFGGSNRTGVNQVAGCTFALFTKNRTREDVAGNINPQDYKGLSGVITQGNRLNDFIERYGWFKPRLAIDGTGSTPAGVAYIVM